MAPKPCCIAPIQPLIYNTVNNYRKTGISMTAQKRKLAQKFNPSPNKKSKSHSADIRSKIDRIIHSNSVQSDTLIQLLIKHGHTSWPEKADWTMIHYAISSAASHGQTTCLTALLDRHHNTPWPGSEGWSMVHYAIHQATKYGKTDCLSTLLNQYGDTPVPGKADYNMIHFAIQYAARFGKTSCLLTLLNQYKDTSCAGIKSFKVAHYAIGLAAKSGQTNCLLMLLDQYGRTPSPLSKDGTIVHDAISSAAFHGQTTCLTALLDRYHNTTWPGSEGWSMVHYAIYEAAKHGKTNCLLTLLNQYGDTPVPGKADCLLTLLNKYKDTPWPGREGWTMVHFAIDQAAKYGKTDCLLKLLEKYKHTPWPREADWTMVHYAITNGIENNQISCVEKVLIKYKDTLCPTNNYWRVAQYAIHEAAKYGKTDCLKQLLTNYGNSPCPKYKNGFTLYHFGLDRLKYFNKVTPVECIELLHWIKERLINDYQTKNTHDQTKQQIEALIDLNKTLKIDDYESLYHEFFNGIYPQNQDPRFFQAINVSPMSLLCVLFKIGSPLNLPRVAPFGFHVSESPIDKLIYIHEHLSECFLWNYDPLINKLSEFIQEYRRYGPYNHQSNQNDTGTRIINQTSSHISKLIRKKCASSSWQDPAPRKKQPTMLFYFKTTKDTENSTTITTADSGQATGASSSQAVNSN